MEYRTLADGTRFSRLGFGCMRFPRTATGIDMEATRQLIMHALDEGLNYFDTAYLYGGSEETLGEILASSGRRGEALIATKLPQYLVRKTEDLDKFFDEELRRLQTDYVDFYLMHMIADAGRWEKLCSLGIREWLGRKVASGQIRHVGFSFHGNTDTFRKLIDAYDKWDFCMIQYNYLDENTQAGRRGLEYAAEKGLPVFIMEPLRGGRLVNHLPKAATDAIAQHPTQRSAAEWAFRWLFDQENVACVLSGMNSMEMLTENIRVVNETQVGSLTPEDHDMIATVRDAINATSKVGCTGCGYCLPCPKGVNIPGTFTAYNRMFSEAGKMKARMDYVMLTAFSKEGGDPSKCIECGACTRHCPQHLDIPARLKEAGAALIPWYLKPARAVVTAVMSGK